MGKKIVAELGLDETVDTLGRWMVHYIAEMIEEAEAATGVERAQKMSECSKAILDLWSHRHEFPGTSRPFKDFEKILQTLENLDPNKPILRYFDDDVPEIDEDETASTQWLKLATELDHSAKTLIRYCLSAAASTAVDKSQEWVALAEAATEEADPDVEILRVLLDDVNRLDEANPDEVEKERIKGLLERLEIFIESAKEFRHHLRRKLDE